MCHFVPWRSITRRKRRRGREGRRSVRGGDVGGAPRVARVLESESESDDESDDQPEADEEFYEVDCLLEEEPPRGGLGNRSGEGSRFLVTTHT